MPLSELFDETQKPLGAKERLTQLKLRVAALQSSKDQINREQGIEQQKLNEAYAKLKELGVESPETLTAKELQALADSTKVQLDEKLTALEEQLTQGETLIAKYQQLQA